MEQLNWLAKANVQARHFVGNGHLTCLHLPTSAQECIVLIVPATLMCKWTVILLHMMLKIMHICLIARAASQYVNHSRPAGSKARGSHCLRHTCVLLPKNFCREGMGDEGGLAVASRRFLFTYDGQEYVWMKHRRFSGDNISCQNLSTGNVVAYYTNKMLPKKLQGVLVIEPQVSSQDGVMLDYIYDII